MRDPDRDEPRPGHRALGHLARVLEQRPHKDDIALSDLTRCLGFFRADLVARRDAERDSARYRECLGHLNAIIGVAMGMHFPIGTPPWEEFAKTRGWLEELVAEVEP